MHLKRLISLFLTISVAVCGVAPLVLLVDAQQHSLELLEPRNTNLFDSVRYTATWTDNYPQNAHRVYELLVIDVVAGEQVSLVRQEATDACTEGCTLSAPFSVPRSFRKSSTAPVMPIQLKLTRKDENGTVAYSAPRCQLSDSAPGAPVLNKPIYASPDDLLPTFTWTHPSYLGALYQKDLQYRLDIFIKSSQDRVYTAEADPGDELLEIVEPLKFETEYRAILSLLNPYGNPTTSTVEFTTPKDNSNSVLVFVLLAAVFIFALAFAVVLVLLLVRHLINRRTARETSYETIPFANTPASIEAQPL